MVGGRFRFRAIGVQYGLVAFVRWRLTHRLTSGLGGFVRARQLPVYDQPICPGEGYIGTPRLLAFELELITCAGDRVDSPRPVIIWWTHRLRGLGRHGILLSRRLLEPGSWFLRRIIMDSATFGPL